MKKSIKKACSIALLLTSTVALTGANALVIDSISKNNTNAQIFADQQPDALTMLKIQAYNDTAVLGETYQIPEATFVVNNVDQTQSATITKTVTDSIGRQVDVDGDNFVVNGIGVYTITYTVDYLDTTYSTSIEVNASISENSIEIVENTVRTLPKDVYLSYDLSKEENNIYIPKANVVFADEDLALDYEITTEVTSPSQQKISFDADGKLDKTHVLEEGTYSVRYTAKTTDGVYLNSVTKEFTVINDDGYKSKYGSLDYTLSFDYSSTAPTTADIGDELVLPKAVGRIGDQETNVYYTVQAYVFIDGTTHDVTDQAITKNEKGEYVFTAKKVYTISGTEHTVTNGRYQFYYNVTDALGKKAERTGFSISGVKDTQAPTIVITDSYTVGDEVVDKSYNLQNNFELGQNVVLKAVYAEDLADDLEDLKIERYIRRKDQPSKEEDVYNDSTRTEENVFAKDIVFNKTENFTGDAIDAGTLKNGTYTAYYRVTDSAGNTQIIDYTFEVDNTFNFESKTKAEFQDTFPLSINRGEKVTFSAPLVSNDDDERLETRIYYKFDNSAGSNWEAWTLLKPNEDGKYVVPTDVQDAKTLTIRAMAISDAPSDEPEKNVDSTANIEGYTGKKYGFSEVKISIKDNQDSQVPEVLLLGDKDSEYRQNDTITLPSITVSDDLLDYVNLNVNITHTELVDGEPVTQPFYANINEPPSVTAGGDKMFSGLSFYANLAGKYDIVYEVTDAANNKVCVYQTINVTANDVQTEPHFGNLPEQLNGGKLEFGKTLTLPVPQLPVGNYDYSVGAYGQVGSQINKETFTPSKEGTYTIVYSLYHKDAPQTILDTKEFVVEVGDTVGPVVHVDWNLEPSYKVNSNVLIPVFTASDNSKINLEDSTIVISSNSFRRTIYGNEIAEEYAKGEEGRLYIPLNYNEIYTVTYTVYDNSTSRNSTIITEQIRVGDLVEPTIILPDNYVPTKVRLDETLTFDTKGIKVKDTNGEGETIEFTEDEVKNKVKVSIKGPNGELDNLNVDSDDKVINDGIFIFDIDTAGTYTVTISVEDEAGNTGEVKRTFTVNDTTVTPLTDNEIITIVLICVAVLVLAGAVVYAVVSSKKTKAYKQ